MMPTDKQTTASAPHRRAAGAAALAANRRNAQRSTGPRTSRGKIRSSLNALRHGLRARSAILPGEDRRAFRNLHRSFCDHFRPSGPLQQLLVEQMAIAYWKLSRVSRIEAFVFAHRSTDDHTLADFLRALHQRRHANDEEAKDEPEADEPPPTPDQLLARAYIRDTAGANTFARLSQYEMRLERSFYRAWRELRRLQSNSALSPADRESKPPTVFSRQEIHRAP